MKGNENEINKKGAVFRRKVNCTCKEKRTEYLPDELVKTFWREHLYNETIKHKIENPVDIKSSQFEILTMSETKSKKS